MRFLLLFIAFGVLSTSCSYRIVRSNYLFRRNGEPLSAAIFKKDLVVNDSLFKVGEINLQETNYTVACSESEALRLLKREARLVNADIINIVSEKRPGINGSCYQCKAEFYKFAYLGMSMNEDERYSAKELQRRRNRDRVAIGGVIVLGILAGIVLGYYYY